MFHPCLHGLAGDDMFTMNPRGGTSIFWDVAYVGLLRPIFFSTAVTRWPRYIFINFILFYFILFYFILFYFILFYFILFYFILSYFILFHFFLFYFIFYFILFFILFYFFENRWRSHNDLLFFFSFDLSPKAKPVFFFFFFFFFFNFNSNFWLPIFQNDSFAVHNHPF